MNIVTASSGPVKTFCIQVTPKDYAVAAHAGQVLFFAFYFWSLAHEVKRYWIAKSKIPPQKTLPAKVWQRTRHRIDRHY